MYYRPMNILGFLLNYYPVTIIFCSILIILLYVIQYLDKSKRNAAKECNSPGCVRCKRYKVIKENGLRRLKTLKLKEALRSRISKAIKLESIENSKQKPNVYFDNSFHSIPFWSADAFEDVLLIEKNGVILNQAFSKAKEYPELWCNNTTLTGSWRTFYFYNQGERCDYNCNLFPEVARLVENLPNFMSDCVFGNACFSVLSPHTELQEHYGPCNIRLRCHFGNKFFMKLPLR